MSCAPSQSPSTFLSTVIPVRLGSFMARSHGSLFSLFALIPPPINERIEISGSGKLSVVVQYCAADLEPTFPEPRLDVAGSFL